MYFTKITGEGAQFLRSTNNVPSNSKAINLAGIIRIETNADK